MIADQQVDDARYAVELARVDLRNSKESLQQAEAVLNQSRELLGKTSIRAPISGTVTALDIKVGETAVASQVGIAGSSLMTIANVATIMTEVNVDEADIARVRIGQEVSIHTAAFPDTELKGTVQTIPLSLKRDLTAQSGASQAKNYSVKVRLVDTKELALRPGMTCRAEIYTASSGKALAAPLQAVLSNNDEKTEVVKGKKEQGTVKTENYLFVSKDGVAEKRIVKIGLSDDSLQEILSGVQAGEVIIVGPYKVLRHLNAGDRIKAETKP